MDRLTCRDENGNAMPVRQELTKELLDKLAVYEDAEEQGLLVIYPVKLGSTVYFNHREYDGAELIVLPCVVIGFSHDDNSDIAAFAKHGTIEKCFNAEDIGTNVFLSREEAEAALNSRAKK